MIKTLLFDLGNVLLYFSHERMWAQMAAAAGISPDEVKSLLAEADLQYRYESGEVTTDEVLAAIARRATRRFERTAMVTAMSDIFTPNLAVLPTLAAAKRHGLRLVVVSNTNEAHLDYAKARYECFGFFDHLVLSYQVRAMKPLPAFYEAALASAQAPAEACLFIDDLPVNIDGARSFGFAGVVYTGQPALDAALHQHRLNIA